MDGPLSVYCYLETMDRTYERYCTKYEAATGRRFTLADIDHMLFHAPYNKLVQKAFARLTYVDTMR